jgi:hypothetical protein
MRNRPQSARRSGPLGIEAAATALRSMFELRACWFEPFPFDAQLPRIEPGRIVLPGAEPGVAPWRLDAGVELPVRLGNVLLGRFVLVSATPTSGVALSPARRADAIHLAERVAPTIADSIVADAQPTEFA